MPQNKIRAKDIAALRWAITEAAAWRGALTGNDEAVALFDAKVKAARDALACVKQMAKYWNAK